MLADHPWYFVLYVLKERLTDCVPAHIVGWKDPSGGHICRHAMSPHRYSGRDVHMSDIQAWMTFLG